jgi:hypothetical protein
MAIPRRTGRARYRFFRNDKPRMWFGIRQATPRFFVLAEASYSDGCASKLRINPDYQAGRG